MWVKVLAIREIRQARVMFWVLPIVHFLMLGMQRINAWFMGEQYWIDMRIAGTHSMLDAYQYGGLESSSRMWLVIALFLLALIQLAAERRNGVQELLFSLPYSRRQIFITKWLVGIGLLTGSLVINTGIDMVVMASSPVSSYFSLMFHINEVLYSLLVGVALYSFALFLGAICGSMASQGVISFMVFILPIGIWELVRDFMNVHHIPYRNDYYSYSYRFQDYFNITSYVGLQYDWISLKHVIVLGIILLVTAWGGIRAFERNRAENNGKLLIFNFWERVVEVGFVVCFTLLSASFVSSMFNNSDNTLLMYYIGLVTGVFLGIFIIRRLTRMRLKI
ncbi:ABC transporter permease subunit [Cohnella sp.]|uniref:ABC transporter permease subunit n=1 Tax=Cohnella sp. TaxID=1883426 RepID=UPI00356AA99D